MVDALHHPKCLLASAPSPDHYQIWLNHAPLEGSTIGKVPRVLGQLLENTALNSYSLSGAGAEAKNCNSILGSPLDCGTWEDSYISHTD